MILKRKTVLIAVGAALAVAVGIGGSVLHQEVNQRNEAATTSHVSLTYDADFSDDANLAGAAEDLFYGKVTALKGQKDLGIGPETQYAVEVQRVFKGDVTGVVVVNQQGGEDEDGNVVNLPEDDALLEVGKRYLFATKYDPDHRFNTVIPVHGDIPVPTTEAPAPGAPDMNGDGPPTMSDRWMAAVQNQNDLSTAPPDEEPTEEPDEDPTPEPSPTSSP